MGSNDISRLLKSSWADCKSLISLRPHSIGFITRAGTRAACTGARSFSVLESWNITLWISDHSGLKVKVQRGKNRSNHSRWSLSCTHIFCGDHKRKLVFNVSWLSTVFFYSDLVFNVIGVLRSGYFTFGTCIARIVTITARVDCQGLARRGNNSPLAILSDTWWDWN